jgi:hypothetical protein
MNDEENEKIFNWRKIDDNDDNSKRYAITKEYNQKEKEYLNKYLSISKNILNKEKLYDIIIRFNFNEQLILSEIFHVLDEANEIKEKEENINSQNKLTFIPYKSKYGIMKTTYSLKNEKKPTIKTLSKEKKIYKYENNNNINKINKFNNINKINNNDNFNEIRQESPKEKNVYPKRFLNFNKIIEDFKSKKCKDKNNYYKNTNKNFDKNKEKNLPNKNNEFVMHKFYNSKKQKTYLTESKDNFIILEDNNKSVNKEKEKHDFIKENVINLNYIINNDNKINMKPNLIINNFQITIESKSKKNLPKNILGENDKEENNININIIKENNNLRANNARYLNPKYNFRTIQPNLNLNNNYRTNNFNYEKNNVILKRKYNFNINNSYRNYQTENINMKNFINNIPSNYFENNINNNSFYLNLKSNNFSNKVYYNNINVDNNNNNNQFNNNILNQRMGIPGYFPLNLNNKYFYPYFYNSNIINMNVNFNNNNIFIHY